MGDYCLDTLHKMSIIFTFALILVAMVINYFSLFPFVAVLISESFVYFLNNGKNFFLNLI